MVNEKLRSRDRVCVSQGKGAASKVRVRGHVVVELRDEHGNLKHREEGYNLVTTVGDNYFATVARGGSVTTIAGMKLGTATTAAAKSGAGAFVATGDYVAGSALAFDSTFPKAGASSNIAEWQTTWAPGVATNATINRVTLTDNTTNAGEADATHTIAAFVFSGAVNKGALDTLTTKWDISFLGA
jgi:hypothetical protein